MTFLRQYWIEFEYIRKYRDNLVLIYDLLKQQEKRINSCPFCVYVQIYFGDRHLRKSFPWVWNINRLGDCLLDMTVAASVIFRNHRSRYEEKSASWIIGYHSKTHISNSNLAKSRSPRKPFQSWNGFETLHRAQQWRYRTVGKISKPFHNWTVSYEQTMFRKFDFIPLGKDDLAISCHQI